VQTLAYHGLVRSLVGRRTRVLGMACLVVAVCGARSVMLAQALPPIRQLGPTIVRSTSTVRSAAAVRELPHGMVLVNDIVSRRLYMFDSALVASTIVLDSTVGAANSYGDSPGGIIPYRSDSTLFVDPSSVSILVIDPVGRFTRVMAGPRLSEIPFLLGGPYGTPGFDANGRLVFRGSTRGRAVTKQGGGFSSSPLVDSAPIVRLDLTTRKTDTIALFKIAKSTVTMTRTSEGQFRTRVLKDPLPVVDDWSILPDGSIAAVRGQDFHIDFIQPDGTRRSSGKIPFQWKRLGDDDKKAFVDSVRSATDRTIAKVRASIAARVRETGMPAPEPVEFDYVSPSELPDYFPAFETNATRAAPGGQLWIRTSQISSGKPVYYILSRTGELVDRVQLPPGRIIAGFGAGDIVYLAYIDLSGGVRLERTRIH